MAALLRVLAFSTLFTASTVLGAAHAPRAPLASPFGPVVDLGYAAYAGNASLPGVVFWGGIPYTRPPVNDLRFRAPQQLDEKSRSLSSRDIVDARNWGPLCIQQPAVPGIGSEDCVTLNVWAPPGANVNSKLPVYVYIHGGGHYYNSAQGFPANDWVSKTEGPFIVVSLQYRLGLLGFLAGAKVTQYNAASVNNGILDQRAGLQWIQRNIAKFGGDPKKVTIGGESSGAGSVVLHLTAFGGEKNPPFRAAVIQSAGNDPFYTDAQTETCFAAVTKHVGCEGDSDVMSCWRRAAISTVISAVNNKPSSCKFMPVVDGQFIPELTTKSLAAGRFAKVPVLAGHTAQDGSIFVGKPADVNTDADVIAMVTKRYTGLTPVSAAKMLQVYPVASSSTPWTTQWERAMYAFQETEFSCWDSYIANVTGKTSYNYRWDAEDPNLIAARGAYVKAAHTADLFYLYLGTNSGPNNANAVAKFSAFTPSQATLATQSVAWWASFAKTLDPNSHKAAGAPTWAPSSSGGFMIADVDGKSKMQPFSADPTYFERCAFWRSVADEIRL